MNFLKKNSPYGTMSVLVVFVTVLFFIPFVSLWTWFSISKGVLQEIPDNVVWLITVLIGGKGLQKTIDVYDRFRKQPKQIFEDQEIQG